MARRTSLSKLYSTSQKKHDLWMLRLLYRADVRTDIDTCSFGDSDEFGCCFWFKPGGFDCRRTTKQILALCFAEDFVARLEEELKVKGAVGSKKSSSAKRLTR